MIRRENKDLKHKLYDMWHDIFHDPASYMDFYFEEIYPGNRVLVDEDEEGQLRGMFHMNPYTLLVRGQICPAHYLVGVATREDCRRQGVMRGLLTASLSDLRGRGESLTYLMPADPDYYLPFGFRYGADWLEAELMFDPPAGRSGKYHYRNGPIDTEEAETAARRECRTFTDQYGLATASDAEYLHCLEKEAASEHDKVYYLYDGEKYAGRFVMGVAEDYMMLSRIVCCTDDRASFLQEVLMLCHEQYHYGAYHLTLDESWEEDIKEVARRKAVRLVSLKKKPRIMFRIVNLEKAASCLRPEADFQLSLDVVDDQLPDQTGVYRIEADGGKVSITQISDKTAGEQSALGQEDPGSRGGDRIPDGGKISIGDLTSMIFGRLDPEETIIPSSLTEEGKKCLAMLIPITNNCVMEYV